MPIVAGILAIIIFLQSVSSVFAAPQINIVSCPSNLTAGESFSLSTTVSGLVASASYSFKVRIGSSSATMTRGQTIITANGTASWLSDNDAWSSFPFFSTDAFGIWSGTITARPNADSWVGQNYVLLRLKRMDQSSYCCDSASVTATVSSAPVASITSETTMQTTVTPSNIEINVPNSCILGEYFKVSSNLKNFIANTEYYLKIRGGPDESHITKMQTKNGGNYFSDNEGWENFPVIKTDSSGNWSGDIWGLLGEDKDEGTYKIKIRARKKETETFSESEFKDLKFSKPTEIIVIASPAVATKSSEKIATKAAIISLNKSSESAVLGSSVSAVYNSVVKNKEIRKDNSIGIAMAVSGASLVLLAVLIFVRKRLTV